MKIITTLALAALTTVAVAQEKELTPTEQMQAALEDQNISYIWREEDHGAIIYVFNDTDPKAVCDMGDQFTDVGLDFVRNYGQNVTADCQVPAK